MLSTSGSSHVVSVQIICCFCYSVSRENRDREEIQPQSTNQRKSNGQNIHERSFIY